MSGGRPKDRPGSLRGPRARGPVDDELRFHLETQVEELMAEGWPPEEARAEALRRFGDVTRVERELLALERGREKALSRRGWWLDLGRDLAFALRQLRRSPGFAVMAVGVAALGVGANAAVFGVVDAALLRPLPLPEAERLVFVLDDQGEGVRVNPSLPEFRDWEREAGHFEALVALHMAHLTFLGSEGPERLLGARVAGDLGGVLGRDPLVGRYFSQAELRGEERVVLLGEGLWRRVFAGTPDALGRILDLNGEPHTVVGVLPREAGFLAFEPGLDVWLPLQEQEWMGRGLHFLSVAGRLPAGLEPDDATARTDAVAAGLRESGVTDHGIALEGFRDRFVGDVRALLLALWGAVGFLLLIVCANLASLFLSRSSGRARELAVRVALGAGRGRLVRQLVTESLVVAGLGGALGLLLARWMVGYVATAAASARALIPAAPVDGRVALFGALLALVTGVLFGLVPARRAVGMDMGPVLKEEGETRVAGSRGAARSRRLLVGAEVALSLVLLVGAGLMLRSLVRLLDVDPGFEPGGALAVSLSLPGTRYGEEAAQVRFFEDLLARVRSLPGVVEAGGGSRVPLSPGDTRGGFAIPGREFLEGQGPWAAKRIATPGYFEALRIPLLRGRTFDATDRPEGPEAAIVSQSLAARYWPGEDPVGQRIRFSWGPGDVQEVVGVVGDVRHEGLDRDVAGTIYVPLTQFPQQGFTVVVRTRGDPLALVEPIRSEVLAMDPQQPLGDVTTLDGLVRRATATRRTLAHLLGGFAILALVLGAVGVYAVTAQSVGRRTREIGLRVAVGANRGDVLRLVLAEQLPVVGAGLATGVFGAWAATRALAGSLYGVSATDPGTFAAVCALLAAVALAATWLPAARAARMDPVAALRGE